MRRLSLRAIAAAFTFAVGIATASLWSIQNRAEPALESARKTGAPTASESQADAVTVTFKQSYWNEDRTVVAEFVIANGSDEALYYMGYGEGDNAYWSIRRGRRSTHHSPSCATGIKERKLLPGGRLTFRVYPGRESSSAEAGFEFFVGEDRLRQTIWSDNFYIP